MPIKLSFSCPADWSQMNGCDKSKFCGSCQKSVQNFVEHSEDEIKELLSQTDTCARLTYNNKGQIKTKSGFSTTLILSSALAFGCFDATQTPIENNENTNSNTNNNENTETFEVEMGDVEEVEMGEVGTHEVEETPSPSTTDTNVKVGDLRVSTGKIHRPPSPALNTNENDETKAADCEGTAAQEIVSGPNDDDEILEVDMGVMEMHVPQEPPTETP